MPNSAAFDSCPHDRGPGIAVCLRCRAEANRRASARQRSIAARIGMGIAGAVVLIVAGNGLVAARQSGRGGHAEELDAASAAEAPARSFSVAQASASAAAVAPATTTAPVIAVSAGRTDLAGGAYIQRDGDSVAVRFDTPAHRTRRRDKFEDEVRRTLPLVYGALADSALAAVPAGALAASGDLLRDLPAHGIALPAQRGWTLTVWPGVRPGQDGPLVVSYRVSLDRAR